MAFLSSLSSMFGDVQNAFNKPIVGGSSGDASQASGFIAELTKPFSPSNSSMTWLDAIKMLSTSPQPQQSTAQQQGIIPSFHFLKDKQQSDAQDLQDALSIVGFLAGLGGLGGAAGAAVGGGTGGSMLATGGAAPGAFALMP